MEGENPKKGLSSLFGISSMEASIPWIGSEGSFLLCWTFLLRPVSFDLELWLCLVGLELILVVFGLQLTRYRDFSEMFEEFLLYFLFWQKGSFVWKLECCALCSEVYGGRDNKIIRWIERESSNLWTYVRLNVSLWTSVTIYFCNYLLGLILLVVFVFLCPLYSFMFLNESCST